jgi:hypothetical protein
MEAGGEGRKDQGGVICEGGSGRSDLARQQRNELLVFPNEALSGCLSLTVFCGDSGLEAFNPEFSFSTRRLE